MSVIEITKAVRSIKARSAVEKGIETTPAFKKALADLEWVAVCLVGYEGPAPVRIGSNATQWPVYIATGSDLSTVAYQADLRSPQHRVVVLEHVWTVSDAHARRLKAAMDLALLGDDPGMVRLRHAWRDLPDPKSAWGELLRDAIQVIEHRGERIDVFDGGVRKARALDLMRRRTRE